MHQARYILLLSLIFLGSIHSRNAFANEDKGFPETLYFTKCTLGTGAHIIPSNCLIKLSKTSENYYLATPYSQDGKNRCNQIKSLPIAKQKLETCLVALDPTAQLANIQKQLVQRELCDDSTEALDWAKMLMQWNYCSAVDLIKKQNAHDTSDLNLVKRNQWDDQAQKALSALKVARVPQLGTPRGIVIHHAEMATHPSNVKAIRRIHRQENKWADIGYHFMICPDQDGTWKVFEGRPLTYEGAHSGPVQMGEWKTIQGKKKWVVQKRYDSNAGQIGIVVCGNYDPYQVGKNETGFLPDAPEALRQPPPEAVVQLNSLITTLKKKYTDSKSGASSIQSLYTHGLGPHARNPGHKSCPGEAMLHIVNALKESHGLSTTVREWEDPKSGQYRNVLVPQSTLTCPSSTSL